MDMPVLTDLDKHLLQSAINSQVCALKKRRKGLYQRFMDKDLPEKNYQSGLVALAKHIRQLHDLKKKLGCWEGFSQQPKKGIHAASNATGNQSATQGDS
jgi:hypothetical protein